MAQGKSANRRKPKGPAWAFLCRAGGEEELIAALPDGAEAERLAEGVVLSQARPKRPDGQWAPLPFARHAMRTNGRAVALDPHALADALASEMKTAADGRTWPWTLQLVAPDCERPNDPRKRTSRRIDEAITDPLDKRLPRALANAFVDGAKEAERIAQVWVLDDSAALVGLTPVVDALAPSPSRRLDGKTEAKQAQKKLKAGVEWAGIEPTKGDACVVFESGGAEVWAAATLANGARVLSVARNTKKGQPHKRMLTIRESPFEYYPEDTVDWLLCNLSQRPLETAKLVAKWARRAWAHHVLFNLRLPADKRVEFVADIIAMLEDAGWEGVKARQLYFDRNEVMLYAYLAPKLAARGWQAPYGFDRKLKEERKKGEQKSAGPRASGRGRARARGRAKGRAKGRSAGAGPRSGGRGRTRR